MAEILGIRFFFPSATQICGFLVFGVDAISSGMAQVCHSSGFRSKKEESKEISAVNGAESDADQRALYATVKRALPFLLHDLCSWKPSSSVTYFHSADEACIPVDLYIDRLVGWSNCSSECLILAFVFLYRLQIVHGHGFDSCMLHRLLLSRYYFSTHDSVCVAE